MYFCFQAYQTSSQSFDSDYGSSSVRGSPYSRQSSMDSVHYPSTTREARDRKVLSTSSLDTHAFEAPDPFTHLDDPIRRQLRTSTSYTSGLSVFRDSPQQLSGQDDETMKKSVFLDRRREFETRAAQENVNPNSSKAYSFGLYFPKKETKVNSAENLARSVVIRRSRENVLQSTDSQENISKLHPGSRVRNVPIEYRHSGSPDQKVPERFKSQEVLTRDSDSRGQSHHGSGSSIRHSFPDSGSQIWSPPVRKTSETNSPYFDRSTPTSDNIPSKRESYCGTRQYVPVINESSIGRNQKMSGSVDSIDPRSNVYHSEHHLRTSYNSGAQSSEQPNQNQPSSSRTVIVKINDKHDRSSTPTASQSPIGQAGNHSYGAAFALTRSPATEIEIRQKREPRILVSHRKKQFETREDMTPPPNGNSGNSTGNSGHRYKTEIERYTRKFEGVQARLASFEKHGSEPMRSRSQTPVSAQPIKVRRMSQERVRSPEPDSSNTQYSQGNGQSNFSDSAPIRIYVSQGNSNTSGSPIVEIVPVQSCMEIEPRGQGQFVAHSNQTDSVDHGDGEGQKPVRKASFLSAVNAPYSRCKYI